MTRECAMELSGAFVHLCLYCQGVVMLITTFLRALLWTKYWQTAHSLGITPTVCVYWVEMEEQFLRKRMELKSWPWPNWSNKGFFVDISRVLRLHIEVPRVPHQMSEHIVRHFECFYETLSHLSDTIVKLCILFHDVFAEAKCTVVAMTHSSSCKLLLPGHSFAKVVNILTILKSYDLSW